MIDRKEIKQYREVEKAVHKYQELFEQACSEYDSDGEISEGVMNQLNRLVPTFKELAYSNQPIVSLNIITNTQTRTKIDPIVNFEGAIKESISMGGFEQVLTPFDRTHVARATANALGDVDKKIRELRYTNKPRRIFNKKNFTKGSRAILSWATLILLTVVSGFVIWYFGWS